MQPCSNARNIIERMPRFSDSQYNANCYGLFTYLFSSEYVHPQLEPSKASGQSKITDRDSDKERTLTNHV